MADVSERPVIFNEWEIRRTLADEKSQFRRIQGLKKYHDWRLMHLDYEEGPVLATFQKDASRGTNIERYVEYPYGEPGDALWVRERFRFEAEYDEMSPKEYLKTVDRDHWAVLYESDHSVNGTGVTESPENGWGRIRTAIHMPRELCRLRLRVEDVRVERVQEASPADALAEGIARIPEINRSGEVVGEKNPVGGLKKRWNDIHGEGAWKRNDRVWVTEFSLIDQ